MKKAFLAITAAALATTGTAAQADQFLVAPYSEVVARGYGNCVNQYNPAASYGGSLDWYLRNPFPMTLIFTCEKVPAITR